MQSVFVYTREAHPGEHRPAHHSMGDKLTAARAFRDEWSVRRPILVDDLDGTLHRSYGMLPNMAFVVSGGGQLVYKANWTDASHLALVVQRTLDERAPGPAGTSRRRMPFEVEWAPRRSRDDDAFLNGLLAAGPRAVMEYITAVEASAGPAAGRSHRRWWAATKEKKP